MTDPVSCSKCDKVLGYGYNGCNIQVYCIDCWDRAHKK